MIRRAFLRLAGAGALALSLGRGAFAATGRAASRAFPRPPWRSVDRTKLSDPHDLAG